MNVFTSAANQKLAYTELLLQQARQAMGHHHLQQALLQAAVLQLEMAYRFYLREIADTYQCKNAADIGDLWSLIANLQLQGKNPAETCELYNLNGDPKSWLNDLQACGLSITQPPEPPRARNADSNLIAAVSIAQRHDGSNLGPELVGGWLQAFSDLVERHRQAMVEC